jgi:NTP pyrophosphatase (non-canonical NTP hydrolase)
VRLADFIVDWLVSRNRGELDEVFGNMRRRDYENLKEELELILACGGKPPNWV